MEVTEEGMVIDDKPGHIQNAFSPMEVTEDGIVIEDNLSQA